jgi:hypothetical protein
MIDYMDARYDRLADLGYNDQHMARLSSRSADEILSRGVAPQHWDLWDDDDQPIEIPVPPHAAPQANGHAAAALASTVASVPFMITAAMKTELRARGCTDAQIADMRPAEAHKILNGAAAASPSPPTQPDQKPSQPEHPQAGQSPGCEPPSDDDAYESPIADPAAAKIINDAIRAVRLISDPRIKKQAITTAGRKLDPITQGDAIDYLSDVAIDNLGLDPMDVQDALAEGRKLREGIVRPVGSARPVAARKTTCHSRTRCPTTFCRLRPST